ncbi:MAG: hypothetical protein F6K24_06910, partial [Okeania sp. SIO2D1]|nr:hypothetical protein [Okeania sp. SIO2D1]
AFKNNDGRVYGFSDKGIGFNVHECVGKTNNYTNLLNDGSYKSFLGEEDGKNFDITEQKIQQSIYDLSKYQAQNNGVKLPQKEANAVVTLLIGVNESLRLCPIEKDVNSTLQGKRITIDAKKWKDIKSWGGKELCFL